jgi:hypothetical protein
MDIVFDKNISIDSLRRHTLAVCRFIFDYYKLKIFKKMIKQIKFKKAYNFGLHTNTGKDLNGKLKREKLKISVFKIIFKDESKSPIEFQTEEELCYFECNYFMTKAKNGFTMWNENADKIKFFDDSFGKLCGRLNNLPIFLIDNYVYKYDIDGAFAEKIDYEDLKKI